MNKSGIFLSIILLSMSVDNVSSETQWINNISINEYNISWNYIEIFTGMDSIAYRIGLDSGIGNNDSFINAWEVLKADREARSKFRASIEKEPDVRIDNQTSGIRIKDVGSNLTQGLIGKTHSSSEVKNEYTVIYILLESFYNASSIWFLGEPGSRVTIIIPQGVDIINVSGINNSTTVSGVIQGYFSNSSTGKGEITVNFTKNASYYSEPPAVNITETISEPENETENIAEIPGNIWEWIIAGTGIIVIILIYVLKIRS